LSAIATDYTWADDFITSETLREEALKLAENTLGAIRIEDGLEHIRASARQQRVFGSPISSAPALGTFNTVGCTLYGSSDYDPETKSYATTHYFVALMLPLLPLGRYRVINVGGNTYRFLGKLPFRKADRWHLGIVLSGVAAMILFGMINSNQSQSYTPSTTTSSSYASPAGQNADSSTSDTTSGNATSSSQSTSETSELSDLRKRIEAGRTRMTALETQLQPVSDELDSLTARIKPLEAEIKALDQQHAEGMEIDRDRRNSLYNEYEPLFKRRRALFEANSSDFKVLDDLGKADKEMMEQWKALGGKVN
jgi:HAMP domain-containing protein